MQDKTAQLWAKQDQHPGDRLRLFQAVADAVPAQRVLYAGSYCDIAPSFVYPDVTYVDMDKRAAAFFADAEGVQEIIAENAGRSANVAFIHSDYAKPLGLEDGTFDLLISLYAGFISEACTRYLRIGGTLLANPSHGDAALASIDPRYRLAGVVLSGGGKYRFKTTGLEEYLAPKKPTELTAEAIHKLGRGIAYTKPAFAYLFERVE